MDIHVLDTINKANSNIEELVEKVVSLKRLNNMNNCCYGALENRPECKGNCNKCTDDYYDKMYEDMLNEYSVSL
ncbi:hypothetical protein EXM90_19190 [Clostridium botulinum]|uniref:hypothetical protein n=1 Tax=Clostridium botulinum TaxID=1491 RepID=UPI0004674E3E|nr:hypothetical protein [Clostridium botulinum]APR02419.1 hypothetical protein RSJ2_3929 [Clostridium botulinum]AUN01459.1 hypothetical protein RSJ19_00310 [Clostridium botulinum]MBN3367261.1 hypothetical protein [Clostridium botulinum]MBN3371645.1 hypothetical protein [Clostridium botulinum]MBN3375549.1 hypothetical protein [Clostridium botulinum]